VLIYGRDGHGKELVARAISDGSPAVRGLRERQLRRCPARADRVELFGHEKGAFTGQHSAGWAASKLAHGGHHLLDEVGELPMETQIALTARPAGKRVRAVGASTSIRGRRARESPATNRRPAGGDRGRQRSAAICLTG